MHLGLLLGRSQADMSQPRRRGDKFEWEQSGRKRSSRKREDAARRAGSKEQRCIIRSAHTPSCSETRTETSGDKQSPRRAKGRLARTEHSLRHTVCSIQSAVYSLQQRAQKRQPNWKAFARANCNFGRLHSIAVAAQWRNKDSHSAGPANKSQFHRSFAGSKMICTQTGAQLASVVASVAPSWWGLTCSFCLEGAFPAHSSRGGKGAHFGDCVGQCLVQLAGRQNEETKTTTTTKKRKDTLQP